RPPPPQLSPLSLHDALPIWSDLPRFAARRRMPRQAVALKKNRCGAAPLSKVSDNEHTTASLGHSEVLSVKNSVREPIPEFCQHRSEEHTSELQSRENLVSRL